MEALTNLIGAALVILNVETNQITDTSQWQWLSCPDVGCTDTGVVADMVREVEPAYVDPECMAYQLKALEPTLAVRMGGHAPNCKCRETKFEHRQEQITTHMHTSNIVLHVADRIVWTLGVQPRQTVHVTETEFATGGWRLTHRELPTGVGRPLFRVVAIRPTAKGREMGYREAIGMENVP